MDTALWNRIPYSMIGCLLLLTGGCTAEIGVSPAVAQQRDSTGVDTTAREVHTQARAALGRASPNRALLYSLGGTVIPIAGGLGLIAASQSNPPTLPRQLGAIMFLGGWVVGPSTGYFYADAPRRAWTGIGIRTTGLLVSVLGQVWYHRRGPEERRDGASLLGIACLVTVIGSAIYDISRVSLSVRRPTDARDLKAQVTPRIEWRSKQVGLSLRLSL